MSASDWVWLPVETVIGLHAEQLEEHGGAAGLRDEGGLRSAVARPQQLAAYQPESATVFNLAAAYAEGLTRNHASTDGNKRAAFLAAYTFLGLNGWYLDATERDAERMTRALSTREIGAVDFAEWLERHSEPE